MGRTSHLGVHAISVALPMQPFSRARDVERAHTNGCSYVTTADTGSSHDATLTALLARLLALMFGSGLADVVSLGAVMPLLAILTAPERVFQYEFAARLARSAGVTSPDELLLPLTIGFCVVALIAGAIRLLMVWGTTRLAFACGADLSTDVGWRRWALIEQRGGTIDLVLTDIVMPALNAASSRRKSGGSIQRQPPRADHFVRGTTAT